MSSVPPTCFSSIIAVKYDLFDFPSVNINTGSKLGPWHPTMDFELVERRSSQLKTGCQYGTDITVNISIELIYPGVEECNNNS